MQIFVFCTIEWTWLYEYPSYLSRGRTKMGGQMPPLPPPPHPPLAAPLNSCNSTYKCSDFRGMKHNDMGYIIAFLHTVFALHQVINMPPCPPPWFLCHCYAQMVWDMREFPLIVKSLGGAKHTTFSLFSNCCIKHADMQPIQLSMTSTIQSNMHYECHYRITNRIFNVILFFL